VTVKGTSWWPPERRPSGTASPSAPTAVSRRVATRVAPRVSPRSTRPLCSYEAKRDRAKSPERGPVCATWLAPDPCASCTSCSGSDVAAGWLPLHGELIHKLYHVKNASNPDRRALPMASYRDLIGRDKLNDLDEILGIS